MYVSNKTYNMQSRIEKKIASHIHKFADLIKCELQKKDCSTEAICELIDNYHPLHLLPDDFNKRKRNKNQISQEARCCANRGNGEQCTRRRRDGILFCGTHQKGHPHGTINSPLEDDNEPHGPSKMTVFTKDEDGIIVYEDKDGVKYDPEAVLKGNTELPLITVP